MKTKVCTICKTEKGLDKFCKHQSCKYGVQSQCKACRKKYKRNYNTPETIRKNNLKAKYNLTIDEYDITFEQQKGVCAICGNKENVKNRWGIKRLSVDHNHLTNKVRGLLCFNCNVALGSFFVDERSEELLLNAIEYLRKIDK